MNINWNKVAAYSIGAVAGASLGVFVATFIMDVVETQKRMREMEEMEEEPKKEEVEPTLSETLINGWKVKAVNTNYAANGEKESLEAIISKYKKSDEPTPDEPEPAQYIDPVEETVVEIDRSKPYPISSDEYIAGIGGKSKKVTKIFFYCDDEVYTDEFGKVLVKPEKYLGTDMINMFGGISGDRDVAYIRNEENGQDYHVILINAEFNADELPASRKARERDDQ